MRYGEHIMALMHIALEQIEEADLVRLIQSQSAQTL
jgi:hypothetical protein